MSARPPDTDAICDFCSSTPIVKWYPARDVVLQQDRLGTQESLGAWAACAACVPLIEAEDREGLELRACEIYGESGMFDPAEVFNGVRAAQQGFWAARIR